MADPMLPPSDDNRLEDDDTLPPEHPAGTDTTVSAGEALSGEGLGTGATGTAGPAPRGSEPNKATAPGDDS